MWGMEQGAHSISRKSSSALKTTNRVSVSRGGQLFVFEINGIKVHTLSKLHKDKTMQVLCLDLYFLDKKVL